MNTMKYPLLCGACAALGAVFAALMPTAGIHFALYLSVIICCIICPWYYALICAAVTPVCTAMLSTALSGIQLAGLTAEGVTVSLVFYLLFGILRTKKVRTGLYISVIASVLSGRIINALVNTAVFSAGKLTFGVWSGLNAVYIIPELVLLLTVLESIGTVLFDSLRREWS